MALDDVGFELWRKSTIGLNPFFVDTDEVEREFKKVLDHSESEDTKSIHFYGSGCSSPKRNERIAEGLRRRCKNAAVYVDHDLLAAARATCQSESGIACILGTGSNSCEYDGTLITDNVPAMGFLIGDEGSGSAIGRRLVRAWIYREMPQSLAEAFMKRFDITKESVLESLYYKEKPNRFLAGLSEFCSDERDHPLIQDILAESLREFIVRHLLKYRTVRKVPIHFVGSIAHYYKKELLDEMEKEGLLIGKIIQSPIDELVKYHMSHAV